MSTLPCYIHTYLLTHVRTYLIVVQARRPTRRVRPQGGDRPRPEPAAVGQHTAKRKALEQPRHRRVPGGRSEELNK